MSRATEKHFLELKRRRGGVSGIAREGIPGEILNALKGSVEVFQKLPRRPVPFGTPGCFPGSSGRLAAVYRLYSFFEAVVCDGSGARPSTPPVLLIRV